MMLLVKRRASACFEERCDNPTLPPSVGDNIVKRDRLQILWRWRALMAALAGCTGWLRRASSGGVRLAGLAKASSGGLLDG